MHRQRRVGISIHALREEGDRYKLILSGTPVQFLSTPSARRATWVLPSVLMVGLLFLSTPSARRATRSPGHTPGRHLISIHALREEGDLYCH